MVLRLCVHCLFGADYFDVLANVSTDAFLQSSMHSFFVAARADGHSERGPSLERVLPSWCNLPQCACECIDGRFPAVLDTFVIRCRSCGGNTLGVVFRLCVHCRLGADYFDEPASVSTDAFLQSSVQLLFVAARADGCSESGPLLVRALPVWCRLL